MKLLTKDWSCLQNLVATTIIVYFEKNEFDGQDEQFK